MICIHTEDLGARRSEYETRFARAPQQRGHEGREGPEGCGGREGRASMSILETPVLTPLGGPKTFCARTFSKHASRTPLSGVDMRDKQA